MSSALRNRKYVTIHSQYFGRKQSPAIASNRYAAFSPA